MNNSPQVRCSSSLQSQETYTKPTGISPDGGWGWTVVFAGLVFTAIRTGTERCFSVFYLSLMQDYNIEYGQVSRLISTFFVGYGLSGIVASPLIKWLGCRKGMIFFGFVASVSCFIGSLPGPYWKLVVCYGCIPGVCFGIQVVITFTAVSQYFTKRLNLAYQLVYLGYGLGSFIACPAYQALIENYTWNGALMIISAVFLHMCAAGATMRPIEKIPEVHHTQDEHSNRKTPSETSSKDHRRSYFHSAKQHLDLQLFCFPPFYFAILFYSCHIIAISSSFSFLIPCAVKKFGLSATQSSFLPAAEALGEMVSKLIWGFFFHKVPYKWQKHVVCGQFALASLLFAILPSIRGFPQLLCTCAAVGIVIGGVDGVYSLFSVEIFGMQSFSSMFGYTNVLAFLLSSVSSLVIGLVIDLTGDPSHAFYFGSVSYVVAAISLFCLHKITVKKVHKFDSP